MDNLSNTWLSQWRLQIRKKCQSSKTIAKCQVGIKKQRIPDWTSKPHSKSRWDKRLREWKYNRALKLDFLYVRKVKKSWREEWNWKEKSPEVDQTYK